MNKIFFTISFLLTLQLFFIASYAAITMNCGAGGPYGKGARIVVSGNVTNTTDNNGVESSIAVNIIKSGRRYLSSNISSDSSGSYQDIINQPLDYGSYTLNITAEKDGGIIGNCSKDLVIQLSTLNTSCRDRTVQINGSIVLSDSGSYASSGTITASLLEKNVFSTNRFTNGIFSINMTACMTSGSRYTISMLIDDDRGKRSWNYIIFNAV